MRIGIMSGARDMMKEGKGIVAPFASSVEVTKNYPPEVEEQSREEWRCFLEKNVRDWEQREWTDALVCLLFLLMFSAYAWLAIEVF